MNIVDRCPTSGGKPENQKYNAHMKMAIDYHMGVSDIELSSAL